MPPSGGVSRTGDAARRVRLHLREEGEPMAEADEPDFMTVRDPATGVQAKRVAVWVLLAERRWGGEVVPVAGRPLEEQLALTADNMRRMVAIAEAQRPGSTSVRKAVVAVEASVDFCVAVALSVDALQGRWYSRSG
jgi:hypothetical protein